jgi:hypothetical protein
MPETFKELVHVEDLLQHHYPDPRPRAPLLLFGSNLSMHVRIGAYPGQWLAVCNGGVGRNCLVGGWHQGSCMRGMLAICEACQSVTCLRLANWAPCAQHVGTQGRHLLRNCFACAFP